MATITPSTFDPLLAHVNVRMQQGVALVDADWNELDDIRKFELRAFLKWYVGDGLPDGNDGFRITGGLSNDFVIGAGGQAGAGGSPEQTALHHVGRYLVDGLDVLLPEDTNYSDQPLHESQPDAVARAAALGVPVVEALTTPGADGPLVVELDVWERLVTPDEQPALVHSGLGVETCARTRREWVVRVHPAATSPTRLPGHSYTPLALVNRWAGQATIPDADIRDQRQRRLLTPPAYLLTDTLGVDPAGYRRGEGRPPISLREAVNALLAGQLPTTPDLPVSPGPGVDLLRRSVLLDPAGGLVAVWQSPRTGGTNQIFASRLDLAQAALGFSAAAPVTSGTVHVEPTAVVLPNGELIVAYQNGLAGASSTSVLMKRADLAGLAAAPEVPVAETAGTADLNPYAVLAGEQVVFFTQQSANGKWFFRRYRHTDATFLDPAPTELSQFSGATGGLHAAHAGGKIWVAYPSGAAIRLLRLDPAAGNVEVWDPTPGQAPFVLASDADAARVFHADGGLKMISFGNGAWGVPEAPGSTDPDDRQPAAVADTDGTIYLIHTRVTPAAGNEIFLRRRDPASQLWGTPQHIISHLASDQFPHPVLVPGQGIWVLWMSDRTGNFDLYAKRIITAI